MKWEGNRESDNVEDRRGGGGGSPIFGGRSIGIGTIVIALDALNAPITVNYASITPKTTHIRPRPDTARAAMFKITARCRTARICSSGSWAFFARTAMMTQYTRPATPSNVRAAPIQIIHAISSPFLVGPVPLTAGPVLGFMPVFGPKFNGCER